MWDFSRILDKQDFDDCFLKTNVEYGLKKCKVDFTSPDLRLFQKCKKIWQRLNDRRNLISSFWFSKNNSVK